MEIVWREDYDLHSDKCYKSPCCSDCSQEYGAVPVYLIGDGPNCECVNCHQIGVANKSQIKWLKDRKGEKIVPNDYCFSCNSYTMETHMRKNVVTKKWQSAWGVCKNCGSKFIV